MGQNGRTVLTPRDLELLLSVYKYRYLSTTQVQALHFLSAQTAARRLRLLSRAGYLADFRAPGVDERLVTLAAKGAEAVAAQLLVPLSALDWAKRRPEPHDHYFLRHFLAASDFRIALTQACAEVPDLALLGFLPEHLGRKTPSGSVAKYIRDVVADIESPGRRHAHTPDGVFALARGGKAALFFLEVDRGTEVLSDPGKGFLKAIRFYVAYLQGDTYQRYREDFRVAEPFRAFRVLIVTTSSERLSHMRAVGGALPVEPAHAKRFIWLTTEAEVTPATVLTSIWVPLDPAESKRYAIVPAG